MRLFEPNEKEAKCVYHASQRAYSRYQDAAVLLGEQQKKKRMSLASDRHGVHTSYVVLDMGTCGYVRLL